MDEYNNGTSEELQKKEEVATPSVVPTHISDTPQYPQSSETPTAPEAVQTPAEGQAPEEPKVNRAPKTKKSVSAIISTIFITVVIATGLVALAISVFSYVVNVGGYTTALDKFMDVMIYEKIDELESIMPTEAWEYLAEENDMDKDELIVYLRENVEEQEITIDDMEDFQYSIISAEETDEDKCSDIGEMLNENYEMSPDCVEKAFKIKFEYSFEYDGEDYDAKEKAYAVKINDQWYLINTDGVFGDFMD